jgi:hypothetical protein
MPLEVADISRFEVDGVPIMRAQECNACVRTAFRLCDEQRGKVRNDKCGGSDAKPAMLHGPRIVAMEHTPTRDTSATNSDNAPGPLAKRFGAAA